ncbi:RNA-binding domain-containing protein [Pleurotus eryngii]|uniref:RNA-binding domain-containing protein n=1 Tax=Pleurotus eryngii TaxID=5323 RepID=A0A9P5ZQB5_PLEER|nr:RNA-binding domain-containing protein [Pleurotus eryngii]
MTEISTTPTLMTSPLLKATYGNGNSQNSNYPSGPDFNQTYGQYEEGPGPGFEDDAYGDRPRRPIRKEREDKVHDSIIEERIQRERPCRTLFIRNIKYETNSDDVRRQFEEHGEIKTFFDLISTRGMVFVTYFDLRAAERARERLQGSEISGRPIDVHYSLPRDDAKGDKEKNQQFQGMLQVTLRSSPSGQPIDDNEVRRKFQQFGDVKSVTPVGDLTDSRYVEFYDTRACEEAFDRLRHQGLQDGVMDIVFAWDASNDAVGPSGGHRNNYDGGRGGGFNDRYDNHQGGYNSGPPGGGYGGGGPSGPPPPAIYHQPPPNALAPAAAPDDRLEQTRKVQRLLEALKQPAPPPSVGLPPPSLGPPGMSGPPPGMNPSSYYNPPSAYPGAGPPHPYAPPPSINTPPPGGPSPAAIPNILALLQTQIQNQQQQQQQANSQQSAPSPYGMPPPQHSMMGGPSPPSQANGTPPSGQTYQQLMAYLQSQKRS